MAGGCRRRGGRPSDAPGQPGADRDRARALLGVRPVASGRHHGLMYRSSRSRSRRGRASGIVALTLTRRVRGAAQARGGAHGRDVAAEAVVARLTRVRGHGALPRGAAGDRSPALFAAFGWSWPCCSSSCGPCDGFFHRGQGYFGMLIELPDNASARHGGVVRQVEVLEAAAGDQSRRLAGRVELLRTRIRRTRRYVRHAQAVGGAERTKGPAPAVLARQRLLFSSRRRAASRSTSPRSSGWGRRRPRDEPPGWGVTT